MRTLAAATFAGGANVLLPVLRKLQLQPEVRLRVVAERQALQILSEQGIPVEEPPPAPKERDLFLRSLFRKEAPDTLLLGTSRGASIEKELLRIGQERGIPSLAVVDHWSHYKARFLEPGSRQLRLPTRIALMDTQALERAVADGLPRKILKVTGQPHLQYLATALRDPALQRHARKLRDTWLQDEQGPLLLFCSELFSENRGYAQTDALEGLAEALDLLEKDAPPRAPARPKLVVKLHPKESRAPFQAGPASRRRGFLLVEVEAAWPCLLAADVLVGMTSMMLLEGAIAGRPAISYQPAQGRAVPFIGTETGVVRAARTVKELAAHLSALMEAPPRASAQRPALTEAPPRASAQSAFLREILSGDAAGRITDLLLGLRPSPRSSRR